MAVMMMVVVAMRTKAAMMSDCVNDDVGAYECGVEDGHVDDVLQHTRHMYYNSRKLHVPTYTPTHKHTHTPKQ